MILTILRHGSAGEAARDFDRQLTSRGRDDIALGSAQLAQICQRKALSLPGNIVHSPWVRTTQSAELVAQQFPKAELSLSEHIACGAGLQHAELLLSAELANRPVPEHLLLVSHQPLVSQLIDDCLGERGLVPALSPGGLATLKLPATGVYSSGCAQLCFWALPPLYEAGL